MNASISTGSKSSQQSPNNWAGFTLIELLVVVAIISILIAILLPSLNKARQLAVRTQCASNMHQIYLGLYMYAIDNQGKFPTLGGALNDYNSNGYFGYYWVEGGWAQASDNGASYVLKSYFNNNYRVLYCPAWLLNSVYYTPALSQHDGDLQGITDYWWNLSSSGVPPAGGVYPNGYYHLCGYEILCNGFINAYLPVVPGYPTARSIWGWNPNVNPPYPAQTMEPGIGSPYYVASTRENAAKVLIADEMCYIGPPAFTGPQNMGWNNWDVAHTTPGNKWNVLPQGANHCNLDGSVLWNNGSEMQERYFLYYNEVSNPATAQYQEWW